MIRCLMRQFSTKRRTVYPTKHSSTLESDLNTEFRHKSQKLSHEIETIHLPDAFFSSKRPEFPCLLSFLNECTSELSPSVIRNFFPKTKAKFLQSSTVSIEDKDTIISALEQGAELKLLLYSNTDLLEGIPYTCPKASYVLATDETIREFTSVDEPTGLIGVFEKPCNEAVQSQRHQQNQLVIPMALICDQIQDPLNLSNILVTAACFGIHSVYLMKGTINLWRGKVVNAAQASHFSVPIVDGCVWSELPQALGNVNNIFAAHSRDTSNYSLCGPMVKYNDASYWIKETDAQDRNAIQTAIIVGNETRGISQEAQSWLTTKRGVMVNIPHSQPLMDSLNVSAAAGILLAEAHRQYLTQHFPAFNPKRSLSSLNAEVKSI